MIMPTMRDNNRDGDTAPKRDLMTRDHWGDARRQWSALFARFTRGGWIVFSRPKQIGVSLYFCFELLAALEILSVQLFAISLVSYRIFWALWAVFVWIYDWIPENIWRGNLWREAIILCSFLQCFIIEYNRFWNKKDFKKMMMMLFFLFKDDNFAVWESLFSGDRALATGWLGELTNWEEFT